MTSLDPTVVTIPILGHLSTSPEIPPTGTGTQLGNLIGEGIGGVVSSGLDEVMKAIWEGATFVLNLAFSIADIFSTFTVDAHSGPVGAVWPTLLTISVAIALGLFFWQLTLSALRAGKGMMRVATGPIAYGIALAMTSACIAAALTCADGLTNLILFKGLNVTTFSAAFAHTSLMGQALNGVKAVALGLIGFLGVVPAALGWVLEIVWRQAAILVLVATVPITAAGLLAHTTSSWFWRGLRWTIAAIAVKPVLALIVVIGLSSLSGATGPVGLLAGVAVLWVSLTSPMALFRLLAFVDPATDAGQTFRDTWSQIRSSAGSGGSDSGSSLSSLVPSPGGSGNGGDSGGMSAFESANTARFDAAGVGGSSGQDVALPPPAGSGSESGSDAISGSGSISGSGTGPGSGAESDGGGQGVPSAAPPSAGDTAQPTPYSRPSGGSAKGSGGSASAGEGAAAGTAEEVATAAVIL
jgi:hypothetical protein